MATAPCLCFHGTVAAASHIRPLVIGGLLLVLLLSGCVAPSRARPTFAPRAMRAQLQGIQTRVGGPLLTNEKVIVSGDTSTIIQPIAHERAIADRMLRELRRGKSTTQKLAEIAAVQPVYDLDGTETRALMDAELAAFRRSLEEAGQKVASLHEELYSPWARYSIWMAGTRN